MSVHPQASAFDQVAEEYERGRAGYPPAVLDWLRTRQEIGSGQTVVDLAAGTGKLTRVLATSGARVIAVEPLAGMREICATVLPDVEVIDGTAEAIPLPDACADVLTCGQAIHWFATPVALAEIARVIRPGGEFVLAQNRHDVTNPVQRRLAEIRREAEAEATEPTPGPDWKDVVFADPHFAPIGEVTLRGEHFVDREGVIGRVRSSSPVARLPEARRAELIESLEVLIETDVVDLTPLTDVIALRRVEHPD